MGLSGLMVWAINLDDSQHTALNAISKPDYTKRSQRQFSLADINNLFPAEYRPSQDAAINYGVINFGSSANLGEMDPSKTGFGFMLVSGDSFAISSLKKRQGEPAPFVFLDCPSGSQHRPKHEVQKARVVCFSDNVQGCFQVVERGVEGTLIEMPENVRSDKIYLAGLINDFIKCAPNSFARAIRLEVSEGKEPI